MFAGILITEYLPLSTLLYSLLKSYRNNRESKCKRPFSDREEDEYMLDEQEENEYECDGVARYT